MIFDTFFSPFSSRHRIICQNLAVSNVENQSASSKSSALLSFSLKCLKSKIFQATNKNQAVCALRLRCIVVDSFSIWRWKRQNSAHFDQHSVKVRLFLFPFTIGTWNHLFWMCKNIFCTYLSRILWFSRTNAITVCNLRPDFKKVKFDVRRSLKPFKDLIGRFDPSLTALTKRSQTLSKGACVSRILSAGVWDRLWLRKGLLLRYTALLSSTQLSCKSTFISESKLTYRGCCMVNLLSWSLNEGQLNVSRERSHLTTE